MGCAASARLASILRHYSAYIPILHAPLQRIHPHSACAITAHSFTSCVRHYSALIHIVRHYSAFITLLCRHHAVCRVCLS